MKSYFPDTNVWVALTYRAHSHYPTASSWLERVTAGTVAFCRFTQLGFLRLLTNAAVMGDEVKTQREAWRVYDILLGDPRVEFHSESDPDEIQGRFRSLTATSQFAPQRWPDAYLAAFAQAAGLRLVTFDRALARLAGDNALLLE
jgi:toxin-antitoxin system PIN domain toxin